MKHWIGPEVIAVARDCSLTQRIHWHLIHSERTHESRQFEGSCYTERKKLINEVESNARKSYTGWDLSLDLDLVIYGDCSSYCLEK